MDWLYVILTLGFFVVFGIAIAVVFGGLFQARHYLHVKEAILQRKDLNYTGSRAVGIPDLVKILNPFGPDGAFSSLEEYHWFSAGIFTVLGIFDRREMCAEDLATELDDKMHYYFGIAVGVLVPALLLGLL